MVILILDSSSYTLIKRNHYIYFHIYSIIITQLSVDRHRPFSLFTRLNYSNRLSSTQQSPLLNRIENRTSDSVYIRIQSLVERPSLNEQMALRWMPNFRSERPSLHHRVGRPRVKLIYLRLAEEIGCNGVREEDPCHSKRPVMEKAEYVHRYTVGRAGWE